jgi:hypothetical protein
MADSFPSDNLDSIYLIAVKTTCAKTSKAVPLSHDRIIVKDHEYPWIGGYYSNGKIRCGGNLSKIFFFKFLYCL